MEKEKIIRKPPAAFLKVDLIIQSILGALILLTLIIYPIAMLLLMPYGAWQVFSGIIEALYGSKWRMIYLGIVVAYFSTYPFSDILGNRNSLNPVVEFMLITIYTVPPIVLGIGYYVKTRKEVSQKETTKPKWQDLENILDANIT